MSDKPFRSSRGWSETLISGTPLILTGLAAAVAFKMLVWNIGAEGQFLMGAIAGSGIAIWLGDGVAPWLALPLVILAGGAGGAAWASASALPKVYLGNNEIITTLILNFITLRLMEYLIFGSHSPWRDSGFSTFPSGRPLPEGARFPEFFNRLDIGLFIAATVTAGALDPRSLNLGLGFTGIIVAALARLNLLAVITAGILLGALNNMGPPLQSIGVPTATVTMLEGAILTFYGSGRVPDRQPPAPRSRAEGRPANDGGGERRMNDSQLVLTITAAVTLGTSLIFAIAYQHQTAKPGSDAAPRDMCQLYCHRPTAISTRWLVCGGLGYPVDGLVWDEGGAGVDAYHLHASRAVGALGLRRLCRSRGLTG